MFDDRSPSHVLRVSVRSSEHSYEDVLCHVFLPARIDEGLVVVHIFPKEADFSTLRRQGEVSILGGDECTSVLSERMICGPSTKELSGDGDARCKIVAQPIHGLLIRRSNVMEPTEDHEEITFWLTRNSFLTPATELVSSNTGVMFVSAEEKEFAIFDAKYRSSFQMGYQVKGSGDIECWPLLVAKSGVAVSEEEETLEHLNHVYQELLNGLDDLLLLVSFASRKRTRCVGWTVRGRRSRADYYRGSFSLSAPAETGAVGIHEEIVPASEFDNYIGESSKKFSLYKNKIALRNALHISLHDEGTVEQRFLSRFSALESLVQGHRKKENLEYVLDQERWEKLKKEIEVYIKRSEEPALDKEERRMMYDKLGELNRVSLREAYRSFCSDISLPTADLWPLFGGRNESGLSDIRNALIHGLEYPEDISEAIATGGFHLEVLLERALLLILGGELDVSKVHEAELKFLYGSDAFEYEDDSRLVYSFLNH